MKKHETETLLQGEKHTLMTKSFDQIRVLTCPSFNLSVVEDTSVLLTGWNQLRKASIYSQSTFKAPSKVRFFLTVFQVVFPATSVVSGCFPRRLLMSNLCRPRRPAEAPNVCFLIPQPGRITPGPLTWGHTCGLPPAPRVQTRLTQGIDVH